MYGVYLPKKPRRVLVIGSGALQIGQAGEFDYSGSQAIKALREEGIHTVLVNPNIATIQTSEDLADRIYLTAVTPEFVAEILVKEDVDALLLSFGGQTALNCGLELHDRGILERYGVRVLGTPIETIRTTEDRDLFKQALAGIGVKTARSRACRTPAEARDAAREIGFPVMLRGGFALGGKGSGIVENAARSTAACPRCWWRSACAAGRRSSTRWCATAATTASPSATWRTSTRSASTPASPSWSRRRRR
jgi:carbamoyl-phosphate synthase large subunit